MEAMNSRRRGSDPIRYESGDRMGKGADTITIDAIIVHSKLRRFLVITKEGRR